MIEWRCPIRDDDGFIHSWEGTYWDKGKYAIADLASEDIEDVELYAPFDAFEKFVGEIAFEANHTGNRRREVNLTRICEHLETLLNFHEIV